MTSSEPAELDSGNGMGATCEVKEQSAVKDEKEEDEKCDHQPQEQAEHPRQEIASAAQGEELEREPVTGHSLESMGCNSAPTGSGGSGVGLVDGEEKEEKISLPPAPFSRPLFGAFEGSFKIPNRKGVEEDIFESFFFYSLHKDVSVQSHRHLGLTPSSRSDTPQSNTDEAATNQAVDIPSTPIEGAAASLPSADPIFSNLPPAPKVSVLTLM